MTRLPPITPASTTCDIDTEAVLQPGELDALLERLRAAAGRRGFSPHTLRAYEAWARRFVLIHRDRHPGQLGAAEARRFLDLVTPRGRTSASTRNQAVNALVFLFREVLGRDLALEARTALRARPSKRTPPVLARAEVDALLRHVRGPCRLLVALLYGSGLRLSEACRLRVRDLDLARDQVVVRDGKGLKDRVTLLPERLKAPLRDHLDRVACQHQADRLRGGGAVETSAASPALAARVSRDWPWQWVFPAATARSDRASGVLRRGHLHERLVQREFAIALRASGVTKPATCHSLRHAFAAHLYEAGHDIRTIQELLGHKDVATTLMYTRAPSDPRRPVQSPLDGGGVDGRGRARIPLHDPKR